MKKILFILMISLFFYNNAFASKYVIIDVRNPIEIESGYMETSINIPLGDLSISINDIVKSKDKEIYIYCRSGRRSGIAKEILKKLGYTNIINAGGLVEASNLLQLDIINE
jgi:phage shock protein E